MMGASWPHLSIDSLAGVRRKARLPVGMKQIWRFAEVVIALRRTGKEGFRGALCSDSMSLRTRMAQSQAEADSSCCVAGNVEVGRQPTALPALSRCRRAGVCQGVGVARGNVPISCLLYPTPEILCREIVR